MSIKKTMGELREAAGEKKETMLMRSEAMAVTRFYERICKEDGVDMEEAMRLCREDPTYSLGRKLQVYMVRATLDVRHVKQHKQDLITSLTPEESEIYYRDIAEMKLTKMVMEEARKQRRRARPEA